MNRRAAPLIALSGGTLLVFCALGVLSLIERGSISVKTDKPAPAVSVAWTAETAALSELREKARAGVTPESLLAELGPERTAELPSSSALIASFRSLVAKNPAAADRVVEGLLGLWKEASSATKTEARLSLIEDLLAQALLCTTPGIKVDAAQRAALVNLFGATARKGSSLAVAALLLLARVGEPEDADRVEELVPITADAQLRLEIAKAVSAIRTGQRRDVR